MTNPGQPRYARPKGGVARTTLPTSRRDRPGIPEIPITVSVGALWLMVAAGPANISIGSITLSAALTVALTALILAWLPAYAMSPKLHGALKSKTAGIPWAMWGFVLVVAVSFVSSPSGAEISASSIQNACVYVMFVGAIASAAAVASLPVAMRSWEILRSVSTWTAYLTFVISLFGFRTVLGARTMALAGVIVLAVVIPGTPRNNWMKFAPFAALAAMALSLSRMATLIGFVLVAFIVLRGKVTPIKQSSRLSRGLLVLVTAGIGAICLALFFTPFRDRFLVGDNAVQIGDISFSTMGRARLWELLLSNTGDSWLLGYGSGAAAQLVDENLPGVGHPHNEYLRIFFDFGVIGLALFFIGYLTLAKRVLRNARWTDHPLHWGAFIALVGIGFLAITDNPFVYPFVVLPLGSLAGLSIALARFEQSDRTCTELRTSSRHPARLER